MLPSFKRISPTPAPTRTRYNEDPNYAEGLYDLGNDVYAWLVPNGSWGEANAGLVIGQGQSLLIDTLWDLDYTQAMLDEMSPLLAENPITAVVNTHADGDHFFGNELVAHVDLITSEASRDEMLYTLPRAMLLLGRVGRLYSLLGKLGWRRLGKIGHWFRQMVAPYNFAAITPTPATHTFQEEMTLEIGGRAVHLIQVGPMHTHGDLIVHLPDTGVVFAADALFINSTPVMWTGPVENWLRALDTIEALQPRVIVPGHGPLTDLAGVAAVRDYWEYVSTAVRLRHAAGMDAESAARDIALSSEFASRPFGQWNSPERIMVSTHTLYRQLDGRTDVPRIRELLRILQRQALLAHDLPHAAPAIMRKL